MILIPLQKLSKYLHLDRIDLQYIFKCSCNMSNKDTTDSEGTKQQPY